MISLKIKSSTKSKRNGSEFSLSIGYELSSRIIECSRIE